jgi:zinc protease
VSAGPPAIPRTSAPPPPPGQSAVAANGLRVVAVPVAGSTTVTLRLSVRLGALTPFEHAALAALCAVFPGSVPDRSRDELLAELSERAVELTAAVGPTSWVLEGRCPVDQVRWTLRLIATSLSRPRYPEAVVNAERQRLNDRLAVFNAFPAVAARRAIVDALVGNHQYGWEFPDSTALESVDAAAVEHAATTLNPSDASLVLAGTADPALILAEADDELSTWMDQPRPAPASAPAAPLPVRREFSPYPATKQVLVRMGRHVDGCGSPEDAATLLVRTALGGYPSARWAEEIREHHHLTYAATASRRSFGRTGIMTMEFDTAPDTVVKALTVTRDHLNRYAADGPDPTDVDRARRYVLGSQTIALATQAGCAAAVAEAMEAGGPWDLPWHDLAELPHVDMARCRQAAALLAWPELSCVLIGPPDLRPNPELSELLAGGHSGARR